ncbi:alpha-amylase family glycosyl hydrolase [Konateibacter massiliensis]|uniref:alpha-amylase family glycosyl hydrolase n=1 Tax=Konateibacter massiliensis TaxID=2002841 RepID=UPI000C1554D4|nr:alpha-amylase family glycosyl hydrolase [Konateibacter massiliensis]
MSKWYNEAVFYHIYPLGALGAEKENNIQEALHRLLELEGWVSHLTELGVDAVYIGPLFEAETHGYDTRDYRLVDRRLGDNNDFKRLVKVFHEAGIKVVVDGVFNHTGRNFFAFRDLKEKGEASPYKDWYRDINFGGSSPYGDSFSYSAWRGHYELANLNLYNPSVVQYLLDVIGFWIEEFDIDGIRLDCADCLTFEFMKEMRRFTEEKKEDFWLMGEVIHGDYGKWANDETLHSVTDYELHKGLYSGHNDHNYFEIAHTIKRLFDENGGLCKDAVLYSFVDNHDVDRLASKLNNQAHLFPVYALLYTLPGIPSIYYGSEWGIEGKKENNSDDPLRPRIDINDRNFTGHNRELTEFIKSLGRVKKENADVLTGRYRELMLTNRQYAFARYTEKAALITLVNNDENAADVYIPLTFLSEVRTAKNAQTGETIEIQGNGIQVSVKANSAVFIRIE